MTTIYPGGREQCLPITATAIAGGNLTTSGTLWLGVQGRNEAGVNQISSLVQVNYSAGQQIIVTFNAANRTEGSSYPYWMLSGSLTNDPESAFLLGLWRNYDNRNLATIEDLVLDTDEKISLTPSSVATPADLPTDSIQGMCRSVDSLGGIYQRFDTDLEVDDNFVTQDGLGNTWVLHPGSTNYGQFPVGDTTGAFGAHQPVQSIDPELVHQIPLFRRPIYLPDGREQAFDPTAPITRLGFFNVYNEPLVTSRRLRLSVFVDGAPKTQLFAGRVFVRVLGYVNPTTGELDTDNGTGDGGEMDGLDDWVPNDIKAGVWVLQKDLPYGSYILCEIALAFKAGEVQIASGSLITYALSVGVQSGVLVEGGYLYRSSEGGFIYEGEDNLRVVPSVGGAIALKSKGGMVSGQSTSVYEFPLTPEQRLYNFAPGISNQKITLSRDGVAIVRGINDLVPSEALLAIADFENGIGAASTFVSAGGADNQGIEVVVNYPSTLRLDVAEVGGKAAEYNVTQIRFYLRVNSIFYRQTSPAIVATGLKSQTFTFSDLSQFVEVSLPDVATLSAELFEPPSLDVTLTPGGGLTGTTAIAVQAIYDGNAMTAIRHFLPVRGVDQLFLSRSDMIKIALVYG